MWRNKRPVMQSFDDFFVVSLKNSLKKQTKKPSRYSGDFKRHGAHVTSL